MTSLKGAEVRRMTDGQLMMRLNANRARVEQMGRIVRAYKNAAGPHRKVTSLDEASRDNLRRAQERGRKAQQQVRVAYQEARRRFLV
jgi:hypothetical protein